MTINEEYKKFKCVEKLDPQLRKNFFRIVERYAQDLPERIVLEDSVYTLHDFNHHCVDIYKIISDYILYPRTAYNESIGLSARELYILDLAVLFHDYSMANILTATRYNHSMESAKFVWDQYYHKTDSVFRMNCDLNIEEVRALMAIIKAHSDVKDGTVPEEENGINSPELKDYDARLGGPIRAAFLAGVLRLADELDVTSSRLGNNAIETQLYGIQEKVNTGEINSMDPKYSRILESLGFWKIQHYFSSMSISDRGVLCVKVDDIHISECINNGESQEKIEERINGIINKCTSQFEAIREKLFSLTEVRIFVPLVKIVVSSEILNLEAQA